MTDQTETQTAVDTHPRRLEWIERSKRHNSIERGYSASAREIFLTMDALLVQWRNHAKSSDPEVLHGVQDTLEAIRKARAVLPTFNKLY